MNVVSVKELKNLLDSQEEIQLVDVRTLGEFEFANIGGKHICLDELEQRIEELNLEKDIYFLCHHGVRSEYACRIAHSMGATAVINVIGGIDAWSNEIDSDVKKY